MLPSPGSPVPSGHPYTERESVPLAEAALEPHLLRESCEYQGFWLDEIRQLGVELPIAFRSEREDWIQIMVAGGFGISFVPAYSPLVPGIQLRPFSDRTIEREVSLFMLQGESLTVGDYVLIHVGYAIQKITPEEALSSWELLDEIAAHA